MKLSGQEDSVGQTGGQRGSNAPPPPLPRPSQPPSVQRGCPAGPRPSFHIPLINFLPRSLRGPRLFK